MLNINVVKLLSSIIQCLLYLVNRSNLQFQYINYLLFHLFSYNLLTSEQNLFNIFYSLNDTLLQIQLCLFLFCDHHVLHTLIKRYFHFFFLITSTCDVKEKMKIDFQFSFKNEFEATYRSMNK